jgi:hypothetical protein
MFDTGKIQEIIDHGKKHDLTHLVGRIKTLDAALHKLAETEELAEIIVIIIPNPIPPVHHGAGWTTIAEYSFALGLVESTLSLVNQVAGLKRALLEWGRLVKSVENSE